MKADAVPLAEWTRDREEPYCQSVPAAVKQNTYSYCFVNVLIKFYNETYCSIVLLQHPAKNHSMFVAN